MGRSQVERNRIKGRPGSKGGGRGGGGRGGRGSGSRRKGPDPCTLGDNAFRFQKDNTAAHHNDNNYDNNNMLLDDFNTGLLLGSEYYGEESDDDAINNVVTRKLTSSDDFDYMSIDIQALSTCLKQLPIHERLDLPHHVGKMLEGRYGEGQQVSSSSSSSNRKKTLAELREE